MHGLSALLTRLWLASYRSHPRSATGTFQRVRWRGGGGSTEYRAISCKLIVSMEEFNAWNPTAHGNCPSKLAIATLNCTCHEVDLSVAHACTPLYVVCMQSPPPLLDEELWPQLAVQDRDLVQPTMSRCPSHTKVPFKFRSVQ